MAAKRSYSRYFIILQEDEKGYSTDNNKIPTGYTKVERKNDKCKVSYYVQNLKRSKDSYYMMLICDRKNDKRLLNLGPINVDNYGRAELSCEYDVNNVANSNIPIETIKGASIVKMNGSNIHGVLSGFVSGVKLDDWKSYAVIENKQRKEEEKVLEKKVEEKVQEQPKEKLKIEKAPEKADIKRKKNIFDEYESNIEAAKNIDTENSPSADVVNNIEDSSEDKQRVDSEIQEDKVKEKETEEIKADKKEPEEKETVDRGKIEEAKVQEAKTKESKVEEKLKVEEPKVEESKPEEVKTEKTKPQKVRAEEAKPQEVKEEESKPQEAKVEESKPEEVKIEDKVDRKSEENEDYPVGRDGNFFRSIAKDLQEIKDVCPEVGRCRWYRVSRKELMNANSSEDFYKYNTIYYPMTSCYSYIKKQDHYLVGYKCDTKGNMRYLVYAIPGTRSLYDQPFGGTTGFVTWTRGQNTETRDDHSGYWLMFYDFRNSRVVVPVKRR